MSYEGNYKISAHAEEQINRRGLTRESVFDVLSNPDQQIEIDESKTVYQKIILFQQEQKNYLVRVIVNRLKQPQVVITAYRTSKISKYYEG